MTVIHTPIHTTEERERERERELEKENKGNSTERVISGKQEKANFNQRLRITNTIQNAGKR